MRQLVRDPEDFRAWLARPREEWMRVGETHSDTTCPVSEWLRCRVAELTGYLPDVSVMGGYVSFSLDGLTWHSIRAPKWVKEFIAALDGSPYGPCEWVTAQKALQVLEQTRTRSGVRGGTS